jgi:8-oxo-dGTP diphosphatase
MIEFKDAKGMMVQFLYEPEEFVEGVAHVFVICEYKGKWLLTNHKTRGWEFPGGKIELNESPVAAAKREVYEETGATLKELIPIGTYKVLDGKHSFVKKVYFGIVKKVDQNEYFFETNGPVLVDFESLQRERYQKHFSHIMQDRVVEICLELIKNSIEPHRGESKK